MIPIEYEVKLDGQFKYIIHNTEGFLENYYIRGQMVNNDLVEVTYGRYDEINSDDWRNVPPKISKDKVFNFKVKDLVGMGAYGFYTDSNGETRVKLPLEKIPGLPKITELSLEDQVDSIQYSLNEDMSVYEFVRLIFTKDNWSYEFLVSENNGKIFKPFDMEGEYEVVSIGYSNEIQNFSSPSDPIVINVSKR